MIRRVFMGPMIPLRGHCIGEKNISLTILLNFVDIGLELAAKCSDNYLGF